MGDHQIILGSSSQEGTAGRGRAMPIRGHVTKARICQVGNQLSAGVAEGPWKLQVRTRCAVRVSEVWAEASTGMDDRTGSIETLPNAAIIKTHECRDCVLVGGFMRETEQTSQNQEMFENKGRRRCGAGRI